MSGGISSERGTENWLSLVHHDDGIKHHGGEDAILIAKKGMGKTTLLLHAVNQLSEVTGGSKKGFVQWMMKGKHGQREWGTRNETIIWRGREYDYWNLFFPENYCACMGNDYLMRPPLVHIHEKDKNRLRFMHRNEYSKDASDRFYPCKIPELTTYKDVIELFNNTRRNAVNIVYEPVNYMLPDEMRLNLLKKKMDAKPGGKAEDEFKNFEPGRPYPAPSSVFWFEYLDYLMGHKGSDFFSLFLDEFHEVCPRLNKGDQYWLTDFFANSLVDVRRNNVSLFCAAHECGLVDWRVLKRFGTFIYFKGSKICPNISMIRSHGVTTHLTMGQCIIERTMEQFGLFEFSRIKHQPPLIVVEGTRNQFSDMPIVHPRPGRPKKKRNMEKDLMDELKPDGVVHLGPAPAPG